MLKKDNYFKILGAVVELIKKAQKIAKPIGVENISQPGIVKEIITADILKHKLNPVKKQHDAEDPKDKNIKYEYLACLEGRSFQFDRVNEENLKNKIMRNKYVYCAIFDKKEIIEIIRIYEIKPKLLFPILLDKYKNSSPSSRHVGITEKEIIKKNIGKIVYNREL